MVYLTGDTHGEFHRFSMDSFPEQKTMTRDDFVIILGDFGGIWNGSKSEEWWLKWLNKKSFTTLFIDGNHENYDLLSQYPVVDFHGGKVHKIKSNIYHLMRGQVYDLCGKKFWTFGGASSHDIADGILDPASYKDPVDFEKTYRLWSVCGLQFRVKGVSWWEQELPSQDEMDAGIKALESIQYKPDFVLTHCLPQSAASYMSAGAYKPDRLTSYLNDIDDNISNASVKWYCGHYHIDKRLLGRYTIMYNYIERVV